MSNVHPFCYTTDWMRQDRSITKPPKACTHLHWCAAKRYRATVFDHNNYQFQFSAFSILFINQYIWVHVIRSAIVAKLKLVCRTNALNSRDGWQRKRMCVRIWIFMPKTQHTRSVKRSGKFDDIVRWPLSIKSPTTRYTCSSSDTSDRARKCGVESMSGDRLSISLTPPDALITLQFNLIFGWGQTNDHIRYAECILRMTRDGRLLSTLILVTIMLCGSCAVLRTRSDAGG